MKTTDPVIAKCTPLLAFLAAGLIPIGLAAQQAETPPEDEIFELPVFEVNTSGDRGYLSTNSVSGTSLNMAIRDIPMPLEVINTEFLEDLQATDLDEALDYSAGVFTETFQSTSGAVTSFTGSGNTATPDDRSPSTAANVNDPFTNTISIRGYAVPNQQRLGFRVGAGAVGNGWTIVTGGLTDTVNAERLEVVRGPASLLYGINVLSGVVNIIPKKPLSENRTRVSLGVGSYDFLRATVDQTGPLIKDRLNYRFVGAFQESGHWSDFREEEREFYAGQLEWFMHERTNSKLFLEAQYGRFRQQGIGNAFFKDNPATGDTGGIEFRNEFFEPFSFGLDYTEANARAIGTMYSAFLTDEVLSEYAGTVELPESVDADQDGVPDGPFSRPGEWDYFSSYVDNLKSDYTYRISGPDTFFEREEFDFLALFQAEPIEDLSIELGMYYTDMEQEEFNNNLLVTSSREGSIIPRATDDVRTRPVYRFLRQNTFHRHPEVDPVSDPVGYGVMERFTLINEGNTQKRTYLEVPKWASYWWYRNPASVETTQLRARAVYQKETSWFDGKIKGEHTFSGGFQYIQDDIQLVTSPNPGGGGSNINRVYTPGNLDGDPLMFRASVFDLTPIRFNPQTDTVAYSGRIRNFSASEVGSAASEKFDHIKLSGHREIKVVNKGLYGIYQGRFFDDRLTFIGGVRRDAYNVKESEKLRLVDEVLNPGWRSVDPSVDPENAIPLTYTMEHIGLGEEDFPPVLPYLLPNPDKPLKMDDLPASIQAQPELADKIILEHRLLRGEITAEELSLFSGNEPLDFFSTRQIEEFKYWQGAITENEFKAFLTEEFVSDPGNSGLTPEEIAAEIDRQFANIVAEEAMLNLGLGEKGTTQYAFPEEQTFTTKTAGLSFRIIEPLSVYILRAEGVFPNQGVRDGLDRTIPAETTESSEIGIKFDLFDRKISGTISVFQIKRKNAIFYFQNAPQPSTWVGEINGPPLDSAFPGFDPEWAKGNFDSTWYQAYGGFDPQTPRNDEIPRYAYGLHRDAWLQAWAQFHPEDVSVINPGTPEERVIVALPDKPFNGETFEKLQTLYNTGFLDNAFQGAGDPFDPARQDQFYWFDLEDFTDDDSTMGISPEDLPKDEVLAFQDVSVEDIPNRSQSENQAMAEELRATYGNPVLYAFEMAMRMQDFRGTLIQYTSNENWRNHNVSRAGNTGTNVTYEEEGTGIDGQLIFSPLDNYQIIFNFSHQQREVSGKGFNMVPLVQARTGENLNEVLPYSEWMRYEAWVFQLGIWNFEDPSDPTTFDGGSVNGIDLSLVPEWNFNLWNKYSFLEGPLEGFEVAGGVRYTSSAPTAVAVGGSNFRDNLFLTPDTEERYEFDLSLNYSFDFAGARWRIGLRVRNLLDDRIDETQVTYDFEDSFGNPDTRTLRTRTFYAPRTWRLSVTALF